VGLGRAMMGRESIFTAAPVIGPFMQINENQMNVDRMDVIIEQAELGHESLKDFLIKNESFAKEFSLIKVGEKDLENIFNEPQKSIQHLNAITTDPAEKHYAVLFSKNNFYPIRFFYNMK